MRGDRGVVLAAVEHSGTEWGTDSALRFATRQPRGDLGVALAAVHTPSDITREYAPRVAAKF